jgi:N-acetylmuramic acid 6-phosphate etherase
VRRKWNADDNMADLPLTESENANTKDLDLLDTREMLRSINEEDGKVAAAVALEIDAIASAIDAIAPRLSAGGKLHYFGAGTSGRLAILDAAEIPPTFSAKDLVIGHIAGGARALTEAVEAAEDDSAAGAEEVDRAEISAHDAVIGISASGGASYVIGAIQRARNAGALTIAIVNAPDSALAAAVDLAIVVITGPEVLAGSTRMKAATAQKLVLNSISTALMVKLGKVHGNLMVDLHASNAKLRARAMRLVMKLSGASGDVANAALEANAWRVKLAVVQIVAGATTSAQAAEILESAGGGLRAVLDRHPRQESHSPHRT